MEKFIVLLSEFPENVPFDAIITLLFFWVSIPALIYQFMASDVRRVLMDRIAMPREVAIRLVISIILLLSGIMVAWLVPEIDDFIFAVILIMLFLIVVITSVQVIYRYGVRESVIYNIEKRALSPLDDKGQLDRYALSIILEIGIQSNAGSDRRVILESIDNMVSLTCSHDSYNGDALGLLIEGLVKMLVNRPALEDTQNYQLAVSILISVLSAPHASTLIDQQHAVRALSALGQTLLAKPAVTVGTDHVLMDYEEALGLAVARHSAMQTDVTQSLMEVGSVALDNRHYLFSVAALERLLTIIEENLPSKEALADLLGLLAHFMEDGKSSREFAETRLARVRDCVKRVGYSSLYKAIKHAKLHSQMTMRFDTADKLDKWMDELKPKRKPRKKK